MTAAAVLALLVPQANQAGAQSFSTGFDLSAFQAEPETSHIWFGRAVDARASMVRLYVRWAAIAPVRAPADPTNPASPGYRWNELDAMVRAATEHGLRILLTVGWAPTWAEGKGKPAKVEAGAWRPRAAAYGKFAQALARRYSGSFPDPLRPGARLPRVRFYEVWNEPNLDTYLAPQWVGKRLVGPSLYRGLLNGFYAGIGEAQTGARVIAGGLAPFGDAPGGERTPPVQFLRALFCVRGTQLKPQRCPHPAHLDALSHHPIAVGQPLRSALSPLNATTPDLGRLERVLRKAERTKRIRPAGHRPLWVTEFWYDSRPPDPHGLPLGTQARWYEQALFLFWRGGARVAIALQLRDSPRGEGYPYTNQSGVFFLDGKPKPSYRAFRFPLVSQRIGRGKVLVWGIAPEAGEVELQVRRGQGWRTVDSLKARGRSHPFVRRLRLSLPAALRARQGSEQSLVWRQD